MSTESSELLTQQIIGHEVRHSWDFKLKPQTIFSCTRRVRTNSYIEYVTLATRVFISYRPFEWIIKRSIDLNNHTTIRAKSHNISDDCMLSAKCQSCFCHIGLIYYSIWLCNVHVDHGIRIISHTHAPCAFRRVPCRNDYVNTSHVCLFLCALLDLCTYTLTTKA